MATYPTSPKFNAIDFVSNDPTIIDKTEDGRINARKKSAQFYSCTVRHNKLTKDQAATIAAFIESLRGRFTAFDIVLPVISKNRGVGGGSPTVAASGASGLSLPITGAPASLTGWLRASDFIRVAGHSKVYRLAQDANTDASGNVTLQLVQPLMQSPATGEAVTIDNVPFNVRLTSDIQVFKTTRPEFVQIEFGIEEDL